MTDSEVWVVVKFSEKAQIIIIAAGKTCAETTEVTNVVLWRSGTTENIIRPSLKQEVCKIKFLKKFNYKGVPLKHAKTNTKTLREAVEYLNYAETKKKKNLGNTLINPKICGDGPKIRRVNPKSLARKNR